jgi:hypothetical protein
VLGVAGAWVIACLQRWIVNSLIQIMYEQAASLGVPIPVPVVQTPLRVTHLPVAAVGVDRAAALDRPWEQRAGRSPGRWPRTTNRTTSSSIRPTHCCRIFLQRACLVSVAAVGVDRAAAVDRPWEQRACRAGDHLGWPRTTNRTTNRTSHSPTLCVVGL